MRASLRIDLGISIGTTLTIIAAACSSTTVVQNGSSSGATSDSGGGSQDGSSGGSSGSSGSSSGSTDSGITILDGSITGSHRPLPVGTSSFTVFVGGMNRNVYLHVPSQAATGPVPLVIAIHGDGDTNTNFVTTSGLVTDSDSEGFILAAPQGYTRDVTVDGQTIPQIDWDAYNDVPNNPDLTLVDDIRVILSASISVTATKISTYGYSQGGYLAFHFAMYSSDTLACGAVIAAGDPLPGSGLVSGAARKIPISLQVGSADATGAVSSSQTADQELTTNGNPVQYTVVPGGMHVPIPGDPKAPLDYCLGQTL